MDLEYYFGGIGGNAKDVELNLDWTRTSLVKVGYDCSLNVTPNPSRDPGCRNK